MILIVPAAEQGRGGGHLSRCVNLVKDLRALGREAFLFISSQTENTSKLIQSMEPDSAWILSDKGIENREWKMGNGRCEFIVLDRFKTPLNELLYWKKIAPVIGIDEGGKCRDNFDFLIDILVPEKLGKPNANIFSPSLIIKKSTANQCNPAQTKDENKTLKILITFGHEDSAGLGIKTADQLLKMKSKIHFDITIIKGALNTAHSPFPVSQIKTLDAILNLAEHLNEYDIVITHYGITAYEALFAGTKVFLAHPTKYHKKLAEAAGFKDIKSFKSLINSAGNRKNQYKPLSVENKNQSLAGLINGFSPIVNKNCPVCGYKPSKKSAARFCERTYRRCSKCGIISMDRINPVPIEYEKEYFFDFYKKQYGKTYLEDFENIKNAGKKRLKIISKIFSRGLRVKGSIKNKTEKKESPALLDIGCAYGPFLMAAKKEGYSPTGIDPANDAVRYVQENLKIPAFQTFFPAPCSPLTAPNSFDIITMWYVIEHFKDCVTVFKEIKTLLKPNGILAFSTPSFSGISGRSNLRKFLEASPADHFTIWSPKTVKKALALAGFKVKKTAASGHHPERFPALGKFAENKKSFLYKFLLAASKLFRLGDTFEVYAVNNGNL